LPNPTIVFLGGAQEFTPPQIQYPWICHGEAVFVQGQFIDPIDWSKLNNQIQQADIVLTAPGFLFDSSVGQNADELARRLYERSDVWTPVNLYLGVNSKTPILVFLRNLKRGQ
jgi:hypothetical protein